MRSSELLNIKVSDCVFVSNYMTIFVESSKTDKYRDGPLGILLQMLR